MIEYEAENGLAIISWNMRGQGNFWNTESTNIFSHFVKTAMEDTGISGVVITSRNSHFHLGDNLQELMKLPDAETIMELSKGQMNELIHAFSSDQNMDDYYERIYNKTASLFATAAESGAILSGADEDIVSAMRTYGVNLGIGFQLIDDILDIASSKEKTGKPVGNDIAQGITTLPVLVYQKNNPQDDSVQRYFEKPEDLLQANDILNRISTDSVVEECLDIAYKYKDKASQALEVLPNTTERDCLLDLLEYVFIDCRY